MKGQNDERGINFMGDFTVVDSNSFYFSKYMIVNKKDNFNDTVKYIIKFRPENNYLKLDTEITERTPKKKIKNMFNENLIFLNKTNKQTCASSLPISFCDTLFSNGYEIYSLNDVSNKFYTFEITYDEIVNSFFYDGNKIIYTFIKNQSENSHTIFWKETYLKNHQTHQKMIGEKEMYSYPSLENSSVIGVCKNNDYYYFYKIIY